MNFIVRTWTKCQQDFREDSFDTEDKAIEYADGSRFNGYEATVEERQADLFEEAA